MCRVILFKWTNTESWGFTLDATFCCMNVTYETTNVQFARWHHLSFDFLWMFHFLTEPLRGKWEILSLSFVYTLVCVAESSFSFCLFHKNCLFRMVFFVFFPCKIVLFTIFTNCSILQNNNLQCFFGHEKKILEEKTFILRGN